MDDTPVYGSGENTPNYAPTLKTHRTKNKAKPKYTMSKRLADSALDSAPHDESAKRRRLSADEVLEDDRDGDLTDLKAGLVKLSALLAQVQAIQAGFDSLLSQCIRAGEDGLRLSTLHSACREGTLNVVKLLVEAGADVCVADEEENTCLMLASRKGHIDTVRYLVSLPGMNVNQRDSEGNTALHVAVREQHAEVAQVLIDAGADVNRRASGDTPLFLAIRKGSLDMVKLLVRAGAGVCIADEEGNTCLIFAVCEGHIDTVRYLVSLPQMDVTQADAHGDTALHYAAEEEMHLLIDAGADVDRRNTAGWTPLHVASNSGMLNDVKLLVRAGAGVCIADKDGYTCLMLASEEGHIDTVRYLVSLPQVDVTGNNRRNGNTALHVAVGKQHANVVQLLIDAGAHIESRNNVGRTPLHIASSAGALNMVKLLVGVGANVCVADEDGMTCLAIASVEGYIRTVRYLVSLPDVDVAKTDLYGNTALHLAAREDHADVVQLLIDAGADIESSMGYTPLCAASSEGALDAVKLLVRAGANVCVADEEGNTCLMLASREGHIDTVRYLVSLPQMNSHKTNNEGNTALDMATSEHHVEVVQVLERDLVRTLLGSFTGDAHR